MFERVGGGLVVERTDDARRILRRQFFDDVGEFRRMEAREPVLGDREAHVEGIDVGDWRDVIPGDDRAWKAPEETGCEAPPTQTTQKTAGANVGGDDP